MTEIVLSLHVHPLLSRFYSNEQGRSLFISSEAKSHLIIEEIPDGFLPTSFFSPFPFSLPSLHTFLPLHMSFIHVTMALIYCATNAPLICCRVQLFLGLVPALYTSVMLNACPFPSGETALTLHHLTFYRTHNSLERLLQMGDG